MGSSSIEWLQGDDGKPGKVWNPITGCSPVSEGCRHCYAKRMANRLKGRYGYPKDEPFRVTFHPDRLGEPLCWKKASRIFVCSMGDVFHDDVSGKYLEDIFSSIRAYSWHTFLILTKRPQNINKEYFKHFGKTAYSHVWLGVSVEDKKNKSRIDILGGIQVAHRFISFEPLLGDVGEVDFTGISWVIVGGETGPGARPLYPDWVRSLKDQCQVVGVPFFFKSWGDGIKLGCGLKGHPMHEAGWSRKGYLLDGREWREIPK